MTPPESAQPRGWPRSAVGPVKSADALGVASAALGAPMLLTGRRLLRTIGVRADANAMAVTAGVGVREFVAAGTILGMRHRRVGAWSRVLGDTMDLALLGTTWRTRCEDAPRLAGATAFVGGILATAMLVARRVSRAEGTDVDDGSGRHGIGAGEDPSSGPAGWRTGM